MKFLAVLPISFGIAVSLGVEGSNFFSTRAEGFAQERFLSIRRKEKLTHQA
jgi:hypothetical protein